MGCGTKAAGCARATELASSLTFLWQACRPQQPKTPSSQHPRVLQPGKASNPIKMNRQTSSLLTALHGLRITPAAPLQASLNIAKAASLAPHVRTFTSTAPQLGSWLEPFIDRTKKKMKGRPRVATGGSIKGTTIMIGDYGLRMTDHHRRISAAQLKLAESTIKQRLRGQRYRLYMRVNCNIGVYTSGNEVGLIHASDDKHWLADEIIRCVWAKEKDPSIIGQQEWQ